MLSLLETDQRTLLVGLLKESGRCDTPDSRQALLFEIGFDPTQFQSSQIKAHDFAVLLLARFNKPAGRAILIRLVKTLEPALPDRQADIDQLMRMLSGVALSNPPAVTVGDDAPADYTQQLWYA